VNWTVTLQDRVVGGVIILNSERHFIYLKWCVALDCYKQKVLTKRRNRKLFTRRNITFQSKFQPQHSAVKTKLSRSVCRTCWFNVVYLQYLPCIH